MPRTKAVRGKQKESVPADAVRQALRDVANQELKRSLDAIEELKTDIIFKLNMLKNQIPHKYADKSIAEIKASVTLNSTSKILVGKSLLDVTESKKKVRSKRSLSYTEDEGYLTAGSNDSKTRTRASRSRSRAAPPKSTRVSRSLSRTKVQHQPLNSYITPAKKGNAAPLTFGTVTPKVKPNMPQVILRRPKQGEVALSLQGSPLMVNPVVSDQIANVNIPLPDGNLLSLQPERGLRLSQIPMLNASTQQQIQALRDNLNKVLRRDCFQT